MKRTNVILIISTCLLFFVAIFSITYAWIIYSKDVNGLDAETGGIKYVYNIDDTDYYEDRTFSISNLTFFDVDSTYEIDDFLSMAYVMEITVRNTGDNNMITTLSQVVADSSATAYVKCLFSTSTLSVGSAVKVEDLYTGHELVTSSTINKWVQGNVSSQTFYVYIFGVQEDDTSNNDFLSDSYTFTISITSTQESGE